MPAVNNQLIGWLAKPLAGVRCLLRFRHRIKCWRCLQNGHGNWLRGHLLTSRSQGLMKNGVAFISPTWHQGSGRGPCVGSSLSRAKGEEHGGKMTTLCLRSKSSGGVKVFQIKLENLPWQLQTMSLFCCKSPQLPNGTGRSELMGLSTPWKVAAAGIGGGNLVSLLITSSRVKGLEVTFYYLRKGHFQLFLPSHSLPVNLCGTPIFALTVVASFWIWVVFLCHPTRRHRNRPERWKAPEALPTKSFTEKSRP